MITTGSISFSFEEENSLSLVNKFPQTDESGKGNDTLNFKVFGSISEGGNDISYTVRALAGDTVYTDAAGNIVEQGTSGATQRNRMADEHIKVYVTGTKGTSTNDTVNVASTYATGGTAGDSEADEGFLIANGVMKADGAQHTHNYTLTMWVADTVTISDTKTATYRASAITGDTPDAEKVNTAQVYSTMYYSLKIKVDANA